MNIHYDVTKDLRYKEGFKKGYKQGQMIASIQTLTQWQKDGIYALLKLKKTNLSVEMIAEVMSASIDDVELIKSILKD